jgi:hypothetical protein
MISKDIIAYKLSRYELKYIDKLYLFYKTKVSIPDSYRLPEIYEGNFLEFKNNSLIDLRENVQEFPKEIKSIEVRNLNDLEEYSNPDFLGFYMYYSGQEGKIFLYKDRIIECSKRISKNLNLDHNKTYSSLKFIVLIHELGHWFSHWVCCNDKGNFNLDFYTRLSKETKESIAQLNVLWAIHGHKNIFAKEIRDIFFYLVDRQPFEYKQFLLTDKKNAFFKNEKCFRSRTMILNRYLKLIENSDFYPIGNDFDFLIFGKRY